MTFKIIGWVIFVMFILRIIVSIAQENDNPMGRVIGALLNSGIAIWLYLVLIRL